MIDLLNEIDSLVPIGSQTISKSFAIVISVVPVDKCGLLIYSIIFKNKLLLHVVLFYVAVDTLLEHIHTNKATQCAI